ncbi:Sodium/calcium exchanger MaX1 [Colletotrichum orbiculare MAFF 240422]|uniref:Sodium/calcium exchanger MaX1 n=1 Tax=Colletotrichum orbiculare (strain 104-T / ATCC 96160 / CBS 514.97 / LARS 414 / MAFF 240422) TaxID=1213857 RepID=N4V6P6_COLOR|nr:Sodium/calcium exchanger MaX1 [Colletotrichum orbiculare MAFF 240422]
MIDGNAVAYNAAVFVSTLFLLEAGADKFVDHTAIVARRTGIPDTLIALLTAGAEWEELAVVVSALLQGRAPLALGNIVGSAISNILGAFSLGLLFRKRGQAMHFDRSARIYSFLLLGVTTVAIPVTILPRRGLWLVSGIILIVAFAIYILSVAWAISRGALTAPEGSDSDGDGSSGGEEEVGGGGGDPEPPAPRRRRRRGRSDAEQQPLLRPSQNFSRRRRSLVYHVAYLLVGFLAVCLSGYVLSNAATNVADALGASEVLFGVVVLAVGTTLPDKFVATLSGTRGHGGILVANTAGSNIFLLTLCLGIVMVGTNGDLGGAGGVNAVELVVLWVSTAVFSLSVWANGRFDRLLGAFMLLGYVAFVVLEFVVIRRPVEL